MKKRMRIKSKRYNKKLFKSSAGSVRQSYRMLSMRGGRRA